MTIDDFNIIYKMCIDNRQSVIILSTNTYGAHSDFLNSNQSNILQIKFLDCSIYFNSKNYFLFTIHITIVRLEINRLI